MVAPKKTTKTNVKQSNFGLKSKNVTGRKKTLALTVLAFTLVGVVMLIRSFAATVVVSFNPTVGMSGATLDGFSYYNATVVTESSGGKKPNNVQLAELSRDSAPNSYPSYLEYTVKLNTGYYQGCVTAKAITAGASAVITVKDPRDSSYSLQNGNLEYFQESAPINTIQNSVALNKTQELCANFAIIEGNSGKDHKIQFNVQSSGVNPPPTNKWRVSAMTVKLNTKNETSSNAFIKAANFSVKNEDGTGWAIYGDVSGRETQVGVNTYKKQTGVTGVVLDDVVNGINTKVFETTSLYAGLGTKFPQLNTSAPDPNKSSAKTYKGCFMAKAVTPGATMEIRAYIGTGGVEGAEEKSFTLTSSYQPICLSHVGIKAGHYMNFNGNNTSPTNTHKIRIQDAWIEEL